MLVAPQVATRQPPIDWVVSERLPTCWLRLQDDGENECSKGRASECGPRPVTQRTICCDSNSFCQRCPELNSLSLTGDLCITGRRGWSYICWRALFLCHPERSEGTRIRDSSPSAALRASAQSQQLSLRMTRAPLTFLCHPERSRGTPDPSFFVSFRAQRRIPDPFPLPLS
jgi:hypothetical protein